MSSGQEDFAWDDDDFDPEAGFQKEDPQNQWEGEDEGLDIDALKAKPKQVTVKTESSESKKTKEERIAEKKAQRRMEELAKEKSQQKTDEDELAGATGKQKIPKIKKVSLGGARAVGKRSTRWMDLRLIKKKQAAATIPYSRDYKRKYANFMQQLLSKNPDNLHRYFEIPVRRNHILVDSYRAIMSCRNRDYLKTKLWVKFEGERGIDYGGVSREWFFLLSHEMFNPGYGLFTIIDNYMLQVNPGSGLCHKNHLDYFRFIGRVLAMAVYHQKLIDAVFIRPFYKMLLGMPINLEDIEAVDTEFYKSVKYILDNDPSDLCLTFEASQEFVGQIENVELKPGGADIGVTESNKKEYVGLLVKWRFEDRVYKQMKALKKGFADVILLKTLHVFDQCEIEYLLCGLAEINVEDWKKHTVYSAGYTANDDVIVWFWKAIKYYDNELRARLLQFVTGTSKVPMNGFGELQGSDGPQKFHIKKLGEPTSLPRAHTCFNRIDLPPYRSYQEMKDKLRLAIENTEGFEGVD